MIEQIKPSDIYHKLYSDELINRTERDKIFQCGDSKEGVTVLVNAVERAITNNPSCFQKFVKTLKAERRYLKLAKSLEVGMDKS